MPASLLIIMVTTAFGLSVREQRLIPAADQAELMRIEKQCCPTCEAPADQVVVDEHKGMQGPSPWAAPISPTAPTNCDTVKCFVPVCPAGEEAGPFPDACCKHCIPGEGAHSSRTRAVGSKIR